MNRGPGTTPCNDCGMLPYFSRRREAEYCFTCDRGSCEGCGRDLSAEKRPAPGPSRPGVLLNFQRRQPGPDCHLCGQGDTSTYYLSKRKEQQAQQQEEEDWQRELQYQEASATRNQTVQGDYITGNSGGVYKGNSGGIYTGNARRYGNQRFGNVSGGQNFN